LAKADAMKTLEDARQHGLADAAAGKTVVTAGPLTNRPGQVVPSLALTGPAADRFVSRAFKLLAIGPTTQPATAATPTVRATTNTAVATTQGGAAIPKAVGLIELQPDGRVLVAQLGDVQALWSQQSLPMEQVQVQRAVAVGLVGEFIQSWFDYDSVVARLNFVPEASAKEELETGTAPHQPDAPIF
jgi:hypothetical protein